MQNTSVTSEVSNNRADDAQYADFLTTIRLRFNDVVKTGTPVFTTNAVYLYELFLEALPPERRQHYKCNSCHKFVETFGGLVTIGADGTTTSVLWCEDTTPSFFKGPVKALQRAVAKAAVTGVFLSDVKTWGTSENKSKKAPFLWHHMAVSNVNVFKHPISEASQVAAEKLQDYGMLCHGLAEFSPTMVSQALTWLDNGMLYRSEKCLGVAKWLHELHEARNATKSHTLRDNITWLAVATAPAGFCHVRSTMIGTLLEDMISGAPFESIKKRFDDKMNPLKYQRPIAAPSDGNIAQAEIIVGKLKSAGALERRFARLEDIGENALWTPAKAKERPVGIEGIFAHLKTPKSPFEDTIETPPVTMTWEKFRRTVLPDALSIKYVVPYNATSYVAMVTAANPDAPPVLQWDSAEARNPVSWYFHGEPSAARTWNLVPGTRVKVTAITFQPSMWSGEDKFNHQGKKVFFLLEGARDMRDNSNGGLFVECMRSEYHPIKRTLEAHIKSSVVAGRDEATACGLGISAGTEKKTWDHTFRVVTKLGIVNVKVDRWD